ncbi:MAG: Nrap protein, partial [Olpidium bornovanus]
PVFVGGAPQPPGDFSGEAFSANHDVVVVDNTGRLNIAAWMSKSDMAEVGILRVVFSTLRVLYTSTRWGCLQHEAKLAMKFLDETAADRFAALFLYRVDRPELKFDNVLRYETGRAVKFIPDLLVRGLRDRVPLVTARLERTPSWRLQDARPQNKRAELLVGLLLNPDHAPRLVDHGPPAEDAKACEDFRRLWGNKSELRRFQNGQIGESVVWACGDAEKRLMIPTRAALYLLQRHVFIEPQSVECWAGSALVNLLRPAARVPRAARIESSELVAAGFKTVMKSFDAFAKMIRGFDGLPFAVSAVTPASSALRYSSLFVPRPRDVSEWSSVPSTCQFIEPIEIIVQLEGNTRWPDDLAAIRQTKLGFYIKFAELFEKAFPGSVRTAVAAAHGDEEGYLDVAGGSGFVFRVRIQQEREAFLMEREIKDSTTPAGRKTGLQRLLHGYRRRYEHVPTHTNLLQALCQHHPSLSGSIRLAKRWLAAHCVLGEPHVSEELAELLTARPFTDPAPHTIPASPQAGFARFLYHLAEWDWKAEPASVDLEHAEGCSSSCGGAWTEALRAEADEKFAALRAEEETAARASGTATRRTRTWIVQTPRDTAGTAWTAPAPVVARRIRTLAKAAVKLLRESIVSGCERNIVNLFGHPTDAYDVLLCLDEEKLTRRYEAVSPTASLLRSKRSSELRAGKEEDRYGGSTVFVLWDPSVREPRPWKANLAFSTRTVGGSDDDDGCGGGDTGESGAKGGGKVTSAKEKKKKKKIPVPHAAANLDAIVSEMTRIGGGLVREVLSQS